MEIRELRAFLEVAREENMTRAAGNLHMSQPSLSKLIKSLEHELGAKLFVRRSFGLSLTKEGRVLRERARDLVGMAIRIEDEFGISDSAVKKQARSYKSVIKLDRNFHIYVHGNRNLLEQGEDEKGKFYKVYYEEEE